MCECDIRVHPEITDRNSRGDCVTSELINVLPHNCGVTLLGSANTAVVSLQWLVCWGNSLENDSSLF